MRLTDDELAVLAEEFLPEEPIEDDDSDNDYEDDLSYESDF